MLSPLDRQILGLVEASRFIASADLYLLSDRSSQETSAALTRLRRSGHLPIVSSAQRLPLNFYPKKTYVYGKGKRGHIIHWLYIAHTRALFTLADRGTIWRQATKHYNHIPDATVSINGKTWELEVDTGSERMRVDRIAGKLKTSGNRLVIVFGGEGRFRNLAALGNALFTWHGYFHELEPDFNILTEKCWWNGAEWVSLV